MHLVAYGEDDAGVVSGRGPCTIRRVIRARVRMRFMRLCLLTFLIPLLLVSTPIHAHEGVILLHGLCRSPQSMARLEKRLSAEGYAVVNAGYPSRSAPIEQLAPETIDRALASPLIAGVTRIHFVTHSMGGLLVRQYLATHSLPQLGRVVMLGPPNQGSEIVDALGGLRLFRWINGPAGGQLGTRSDSLPNRLGPVDFELGVIAGDRSINWINSQIIPGPDDGKVSVERTRVAGMKDHRVMHVTHPFLMRNRRVMDQTLHFLRSGRFQELTDAS